MEGGIDIVDRCLGPCTRGTWVSCWAPQDEGELSERVKGLKHRDFRDLVPPSMEEVQEVYRVHVRDGHWTVGLLEMWAPKAKYVKHAVHIPCWTSFRVLPWLWRGPWLGKTWNECLWTGWRQMRWSRAAYSGSLGREYVMPVYDVGHHGYSSDIRALCGLSCAMACVLSCGIGQILSLCGNAGAHIHRADKQSTSFTRSQSRRKSSAQRVSKSTRNCSKSIPLWRTLHMVSNISFFG
jgi:hypothetical protein